MLAPCQDWSSGAAVGRAFRCRDVAGDGQVPGAVDHQALLLVGIAVPTRTVCIIAGIARLPAEMVVVPVVGVGGPGQGGRSCRCVWAHRNGTRGIALAGCSTSRIGLKTQGANVGRGAVPSVPAVPAVADPPVGAAGGISLWVEE